MHTARPKAGGFGGVLGLLWVAALGGCPGPEGGAASGGGGSTSGSSSGGSSGASSSGGSSGVPSGLTVPILFVSRQPQPYGSYYWPPETGGPLDMPGVGARNRVRPSPGGRLMVLGVDGSVRTLLDGANPTPQSLMLVDVNAPAVSYDGTTVVFAGLPQGVAEGADEYGPGYGTRAVGGWRLYVINADGTGLRRVSPDEEGRTEAAYVAQFGPQAGRALLPYDDFDPVFLPDGRVCFSSTRYPQFAHYSGQRTSQLYVMAADGTGLHRITSERNGADRPTVDPMTGQVVYARWWRNLRFPTNVMDTVPDDVTALPVDLTGVTDVEAYRFHLGLKNNRYPDPLEGNDPVFEGDSMFRNAWQAARINPDGTGMAMFAGFFRSELDNHYYGGDFSDDGELFANSYPMINMTEASGFGGIRAYQPGAGRPRHVLGVTEERSDFLASDPRMIGIPSYGIFPDLYASDAAVLPVANGVRRNGRLVVSMTATAGDLMQDYGLYEVGQDGSSPRLLLDLPGTAELRAVVLAPRVKPAVIPDRITAVATLLPPPRIPSLATPEQKAQVASGGTFTFHVLNVYANAAVDVDMVSAPPIGSARTLRGFTDYQRVNPGSFETMDWPILMEEAPVSAAGEAILHPPAGVPLFEDLRDANGRVPGTGGHYGALGRHEGAAFVAGMNFGRPDEVVRCVGCHTGHSMMRANHLMEAAWTNLAPGARVTLSSVADEGQRTRMESSINDRRVRKATDAFYNWRSNETAGAAGQWVTLTFPVPVEVRSVVLHNPLPEATGNVTDLQVTQAHVTLFSDEAGTVPLGAPHASGPLGVDGTAVAMADVAQAMGTRVVRVDIVEATGRVYGRSSTSLAEVQVVARGLEAPPSP